MICLWFQLDWQQHLTPVLMGAEKEIRGAVVTVNTFILPWLAW